MSISFIITEDEVLKLPNNYDLGSYVRKKYNTVSQNIKSYISDDGYDLCVVCGRKTQYKSYTHIDERMGYVEGVGQTCVDVNKCGVK
jgi:hypothetical protein